MSNPANDLASAIGYFQSVALDSFNAGYADATVAQPAIVTPPTTASEQAQKDWTARTGKGKSQMASAMQQIVQAQTMIADQNGRAAFTAVAATTKTICDTITELTDWTTLPANDPDRSNAIAARNAQLAVLNTALDRLVQLAPITVWEKSSGA